MKCTCSDLGTILKLNIHVDGLPGTMDDVDFSCRFYCWRKSVTIRKADMVRLDADNYMAVLDTSLIGRGTIKNQITVKVPDADCPDGIRTEVATETTNIRIS